MRQLLALFALLTGLAAFAEPVRAAEPRVENVTLVVDVVCQAQAEAAIVRAAAQPRRSNARPPQGLVATPAANAPGVILKADRARE